LNMELPRKVDEHTGEILNPVVVYTNSNEIVRVIDNTQRRHQIKHVKYRQSREAKRLMQKLSPEERGLLATLMQYTDWKLNMVVGDGEVGKKDVPLRFCDIDKISGMSKATRVKVVKSLEQKRAIGYYNVGGKRSAIVVNPAFGYKGTRPPEGLRNVFNCDIDIDEDDDV
jgi:hypothetical protein